MHDVLGYSFSQALCLASVAVDLRVAQVVDKPQASVEAYLPTNIFVGEARRKIEAARHIGHVISRSQNRVFLNTDSLLLNLGDLKVESARGR